MLRDATVRRFGTFRWRYHHRKILQRHLSQPKSMARKSIRNGRKLFFFIFHQKLESGTRAKFLEFYFSDVFRHSDHHQREARGSPPRPRGIATSTIKSSTSHAQMHWLKYQSSRLELGKITESHKNARHDARQLERRHKPASGPGEDKLRAHLAG